MISAVILNQSFSSLEMATGKGSVFLGHVLGKSLSWPMTTEFTRGINQVVLFYSEARSSSKTASGAQEVHQSLSNLSQS
jgi:hypothetical protein